MAEIRTPGERLNDAFGISKLPRGLFYEFEYGLRFELGGEIFSWQTTPIPRFVQAFDRARAISEALFKDSKKLSVVVSYYGAKRRGRREREALADLRTLGFAPFSFGHPERTAEGDQDHIQTYGQDIYRYCHCLELPSYFPDAETLLWGCISAESPIKPKGGSALIYLIDFERRVILHVYDDRGMDIVAMTPEPLLPLYERFTDWLLDHDRSKMDKAFGG